MGEGRTIRVWFFCSCILRPSWVLSALLSLGHHTIHICQISSSNCTPKKGEFYCIPRLKRVGKNLLGLRQAPYLMLQGELPQLPGETRGGILCPPPFLLLPVPSSITVFSNESTLSMRWPKYWSFSLSIIPSKEHPGLISFRMDWLDLVAVQGTLKSLLQHHSSKASIPLKEGHVASAP